MVMKYIRRLYPYKTDSIDEFVNKVKEYQGIRITAKIGHKSDKYIPATKDKPRQLPKTYFSTRMKASTEYGTPIIFRKEYGQDGCAAVKDISGVINQTITDIPHINITILDRNGKEIPKDQYGVVMKLSPKQYSWAREFIKAEIENI
jgi:hypothetical protein